MLRIAFDGTAAPDGLESGLEAVRAALPAELEGRLVLRRRDEPGVRVTVAGDGAEVLFSRPAEMFRGIGLASSALLAGGAPETIRQDRPFRTLGVMYDCSRNSVPTVRTVQGLLVKMALMGYDTLMLYTEDTYPLPGHPEFGHYRGRYTAAELTAIDDFAHGLGIELIPCIQALAHLERFLRWNVTDPLQDTSHVLLAGDPAVLSLIEDMIVSVSGCVRSRRIHLGLDEAHGLGLGRYLSKHGYTKPEEIMREHLEALAALCTRHGLRPMMWGDMIFRMNIRDSGYYDPDVVLPEGTGAIIPKDYDVIYWDYYHTDEAFYRKYIDEHLRQGIRPLFAAGVCSWIGLVPNLVRTAATTRASVAAARDRGLEEMFLCVWKDDGGEAPPGPDLLGMMIYAETCFGGADAGAPKSRRNARVMTGAPYESFWAVGSIDEIEDGLSLVGLESPNPQRYFLWQDLLLGQFDVEASRGDFAAVYRAKADALAALADAGGCEPDALWGLRLGLQLCRVLEVKVDLGLRLKRAYDAGDRAALSGLRDLVAGEYLDRVTALHHAHRDAWSHFYKPFGWEVEDIKYGFLRARAETVVYRLDAYLLGESSRIEELEEERLTCHGTVPSGPAALPHYNSFTRTATVGQF